MACAWPLRLQLLCRGVFAALLALHIGGVRLDEGAFFSDGFAAHSWASKASVPLAHDSAAAWAQRDRDLRAAATYIDSIGVHDYFHLGNIKDILERLEDIRERVTSFGAARDARRRLQIRNILRKVKNQGETLKVLAGQWEAEGEVDDGGDELPTQRENICSRISQNHVESNFTQLLQLFCESLDGVRKAVKSGDDEEPMAYCVSGLLDTLTHQPDYRQGHIGWEIDRVLGEERRWVAKHLAPRPGGTVNVVPPQEGTRFRRWALREWETQVWADIEVDAAALQRKTLRQAQAEVVSCALEDRLTLSSVRTHMQRLKFCNFKLALISLHDIAFRERVPDVIQQIKARMEVLRGFAARKAEAGEVDNSSELLPSQRDNVCSKLEAFAPEEDFREDIRKICEVIDKLRMNATLGHEKVRDNFEIFGRMRALERRPGYSDSLVAFELEYFLAAEWGGIV